MIKPAENAPTAASKTDIKRQLQQASTSQNQELLIDFIQTELSRIFKTSQIDTEQTLYSMGFDSLMAVEFRNRLRVELDIEFDLKHLMADVNVIDIAALVKEQLLEPSDASEDAVTLEANAVELSMEEQMLAKLESGELSEAELEKLYNEYLIDDQQGKE